MRNMKFYLTLLNLMFCLSIIFWLTSSGKDVEAQGQPQAFMGPIYYGPTAVTAVFDHDWPTTDNNNFVIHHDGSQHNPVNGVIPGGYGYDQHEGIDYGLSYRILLAAADGTVNEAGWSNPENHTMGLGLRVIIDHDNNYRSRYGHLSSVVVRRNETITVEPSTREGIIGISGNTGNSTGPHLHFELRNANNIVVNPYGWIAQGVTDPWEAESGATSYDLWTQYPAITTAQYPGGTAVAAPPVNNARITIDNTHDFAAGPCWTLTSNFDAYGGDYYYVTPGNGASTCTARWTAPTDAFTEPGVYDIYAFTPPSATSLYALHRIYHNNTYNDANGRSLDHLCAGHLGYV